MKILIFEWLNSGGLWYDSQEPAEDCPFQRQGCQMLNSVAADLTAGGSEVLAVVDSRLTTAIVNPVGLTQHEIAGDDDLPSQLLSLTQDVDWVLLIAPETDSILSRCLKWLESVRHKLLNPDMAFTALATNKSQLFEYLKSKGFVRFPNGSSLRNFLEQVGESTDRTVWNQTFEPPVVLKPVDGAGSEGVNLISDWAGFDLQLSRPKDLYRLEEFVPGTAVSVSVLCGGDQYDVLVPTGQLFEQADGEQANSVGHYVGAEYPIAEDISRRAVELATEILGSLPRTRGYIGMDLVISDSGDPADDRLIEINPRLTMSYSRLTRIYGSAKWGWETSDGQSSRNLAMRMIDQAIQPATDAPVTCIFREPCP